MVFGEAAHFAAGPEFRYSCGGAFPVQKQRDCSCKTAVFETVVADNVIELARFVQFVCQAVAVLGCEDLNAFGARKNLAEHCGFIEGVIVGEESYPFALCGVVLAKPDAKGSLSGTTGAVTADYDQLGIL